MPKAKQAQPEISHAHRGPGARAGHRGASRQPPPYGVALADRTAGELQERQADHIAAAVAGTRSLPALIQGVEWHTGTELGPVRFQHDGEAAARAHSMNALAFTTGNEIQFGEGQFDPGSRGGQELIAHELVHVAQQQGGPERVQKFEAPKHQAVEMTALTGPGKLGAEESFGTYFGNWMRDLNQIFVPVIMENLGNDPNVVAALVSYLGLKKFGKEFQLETFGYYIPAEHIDSPAGLVYDLDLLREQPKVTDKSLVPPVPAYPGTTAQERVKPGTKVGGADLFSADETGMIAFLSRTLEHIERRLRMSVAEGRTRAGFLHFGAALHAVEDLFAHSNWIEIAVSQMLASNPTLVPELKGEERKVFNFAPEVTVKGKSGKPERRAVLETGSFTSLDTKMSIGAELTNILREPYEEPQSEEELRAKERMTSVGLRAFRSRVKASPELKKTLARAINQGAKKATGGKIGIPESWSEWTMERDIATLYDGFMAVAALLPWEVRVYVDKQMSELMSAYVYRPLADKLEAEAIETKVADTSLLKNLDEARRLSKGGFTPAELTEMKAIEVGGDELGRKTSVADQKKKIIDDQTKRLGDLEATPAFAVAGPSHSMIAKDHSNSPFFGLAFKLAHTAVSLIGDKIVNAWVEAHGEGARTPIPEETVTDPKESERKKKEAVLRARRKSYLENKEFGEKVLEHGGDPKQSYDLAGEREEAAQAVQQVGAVLHAIAKAPDQVGAATEKLKKLLSKADRGWIKKVGEVLGLAGKKFQTGGNAAVAAADLQKLSADLIADGEMIRQARTGAAREEAYVKLIADRDRTFTALMANPAVDVVTRGTVLYALEQQIVRTAVSRWTRQEKALAAAPAPKVEHVEMQALEPERKKTPALVALLETTRMVFSHPAEGTWWHPAMLEYIQKHQDVLLASIEARNARYVVFPGGGH